MKRNNVSDADLGKEVSILANQVFSALKSSVTSPEMKSIRKEAVSGLRATGSRIVRALEKARKSEDARSLKNQAQRVLEISKNKGERATQNLQRNLAQDFHRVAQELQKLAKNIHKK